MLRLREKSTGCNGHQTFSSNHKNKSCSSIHIHLFPEMKFKMTMRHGYTKGIIGHRGKRNLMMLQSRNYGDYLGCNYLFNIYTVIVNTLQVSNICFILSYN